MGNEDQRQHLEPTVTRRRAPARASGDVSPSRSQMTVPQELAGINEPRARTGDAGKDSRSSAVNFVTTEHFALQSARAATIAESTGRATMFLTSVSGGLIALGLVATATRVGTAFYAFGLVLLPTLTFLGLVTFARSLQTALE